MMKSHDGEWGPGAADPRVAAIRGALDSHCIVLVGMMGSGKSAIGQRLAARLGLRFFDADAEIVSAAGMTIPEIFQKYGEGYFRDGERRVLFRLLNNGPIVLATGGGAFLDPRTRRRIAERGVSVWFDADHETLLKRVRRKSDRPLLQTPDPGATLRRLMDDRNPIYATADIRVVSRDVPQEAMVEETMDALAGRLPSMTIGAHRSTKETQAIMNHFAQRPNQTSNAAPHFENVRVGLGERSYDIVIGSGLLAQAGERIAAVAPGAACAIVTDSNVAALYLPALEDSLKASGLRTTSIVVEPGESSKSLGVFGRVCEEAIAARIERRDVIVALGGGVVGDLSGFVAASLRRGARFIQIPTSLLAQVDSSVGGKTGINSPQGKNLIGAFHQPALVLADVDTLVTLPPRELRAGYAEVVKYGLICDRRFFEWLEADGDAVFHSKPEQICAVAVSCETKARIVANDETEQGDRALLNLGHTFGHAFERLVNYDNARLVHGEGVAIGLALALRFSHRLGLCAGQDAERAERHLASLGLPTRIGEIPGWNFDADAVLNAMYQDKKVEKGALTFVLLRGIGEAFVAKSVDAGEVRRFLLSEI
ncbi:3-dehydroquinate synthase [Methylocystis heyeri]|uniref:Multifunctional fusion protein n=1 Tax=Methylocystis heyeri TaxID=391905 RepID=A0A6B8KE04_9HYPH|nr:3-dehydroquinate synthase [Methylocystis heyeri]QGM46496.1 3-dehydroquinate synthase [Methylocystis heyeri]